MIRFYMYSKSSQQHFDFFSLNVNCTYNITLIYKSM